jgi:hypothetical protein
MFAQKKINFLGCSVLQGGMEPLGVVEPKIFLEILRKTSNVFIFQR